MISDLILSAYGPAAYIRMPSDDSVQHAGLDGISRTADARGLVPAGETAWEFGTQGSGTQKKAQEDYDKRTLKPKSIKDRATATFIFVTPRRWPDKDEWAKSQGAKGEWADVKAYDADNLVHWLETTPDVGLRWAELIARRPEGLRQLEAAFDEWSLATRPPLPANLLLLGRDDEATAVRRWFDAPASIYAIQTEAAAEAMAFLYAVIDPYPKPHRRFRLTRCVVADTDTVARGLIGIGAKLVVVLTGDDGGLAQRLVRDGHHVFLAYGSDVGLARGVSRLPRPNRHALEEALIAAKLAEDAQVLDEKKVAEEAHALAQQAAGSLTVLRRLMPRATGGTPAWAVKPSRAMLAAMLVGAWCDDIPADREIVAAMADMTYADVVVKLAPLAAAFDGPLRRSGEVWKLASILDAWHLLAPCLTRTDVERHAQLFQQVMSREDPEFNTRCDGNWFFRVPVAEDAPVSSFVRHGLIDALTVMGAFPDAAPTLSGLKSHAGRTIRKLLDTANAQVWWSLQADFRRLAEAAPDAFLAALGEAIDREDRPLASLFDRAEKGLSSREYHHDLLWALETLAWSPHHLDEAALRLAELDALATGDQKSQRPIDTLNRIFLPWTPQTFASADARAAAVENILHTYPSVGWKLLRGLAPTMHGWALRGPRPTFRIFAPDHPEVLTVDIVRGAYRWIGDALIEKAGTDAGRWSELMEHWPYFAGEWREKAATALSIFIDGMIGDLASGEALDRLRATIRDLVGKHRAYPDAKWAMPVSDVDALDRLRARLEPADAAARHAWLFEPRLGYTPRSTWADVAGGAGER